MHSKFLRRFRAKTAAYKTEKELGEQRRLNRGKKGVRMDGDDTDLATSCPFL
jgi:hypothetical protein